MATNTFTSSNTIDRLKNLEAKIELSKVRERVSRREMASDNEKLREVSEERSYPSQKTIQRNQTQYRKTITKELLKQKEIESEIPYNPEFSLCDEGAIGREDFFNNVVFLNMLILAILVGIWPQLLDFPYNLTLISSIPIIGYPFVSRRIRHIRGSHSLHRVYFWTCLIFLIFPITSPITWLILLASRGQKDVAVEK